LVSAEAPIHASHINEENSVSSAGQWWEKAKTLGGFFRKKTIPDDHLVQMADNLIANGALDTPQGLNTLQAIYMADMQRQRAHERILQNEELRWTRIKRRLFILIALSGVIMSILVGLYRNGVRLPTKNAVSVVSISGEIGMDEAGQAEHVIPALRRAFENSDTDAVVIRINSPGGLPSDSERINRELDALKAKHPKKEVTAVIETLGASAAYMIAVHADTVCSGRYSLVGSVGAIMSVWNLNGLAQKLDIRKDSFGSGKLKGMLDPFKAISEAERTKAMSIVNELGGTFANEVMEKRKGRIKISRDELATGEYWPGTEAVSLGLVDEICTVETVAAKYNGNLRDYGPYAHGKSGSSWVETISDSMSGAVVDGVSRGIRKAIDEQRPYVK
jgi:protease-4